MNATNHSPIEKLLAKGVSIPNPDSVQIGADVRVDRISGKNVTLYPGCKLYGEHTLVLEGAKLGYEAPVTVENCQIGPDVSLRGGFFRESVFLEKASVGSGAQVREGTILEEEASCAHMVGLKQTILFPFVTLGSLINFCDCLMAGGTSRKDHSEVGSSYIHFNYTPNQDKATPSLIGDVAHGVMLNQRPIFLGGQGGLVGPCRLAFGSVIAAGTIYRKDETKPGLLLFEGSSRGGKIPFTPGLYRSIKRIVENNLNYLANLMALRHWYRLVRLEFISEKFPITLHKGLIDILELAIKERVRRFMELCEKMPQSAEVYQTAAGSHASAQLLSQKDELFRKKSDIQTSIERLLAFTGDSSVKDSFLQSIVQGIKEQGKYYLNVIRGLGCEDAGHGTQWLESIVRGIMEQMSSLLPAIAIKTG
jgi:UDP-N-acetylglucosamine/UDP-N-acetylgalactosamine diphosphorylase